jgi:hypothetical protein
MAEIDDGGPIILLMAEIDGGLMEFDCTTHESVEFERFHFFSDSCCCHH